jgi:hypothetical protein
VSVLELDDLYFLGRRAALRRWLRAGKRGEGDDRGGKAGFSQRHPYLSLSVCVLRGKSTAIAAPTRTVRPAIVCEINRLSE